MKVDINPFQQLYFSDDTQTESNFVEIFSDEVLQAAIHPIFQGGNVVLSGTQGCGKTMILSLLRPQTRIAYYENNIDFPVKGDLKNFISAGINLTRSRITDIIQVSLGQGEDADRKELPLYFADFFNYLIVKDLLDSLKLVGEHGQIFNNLVDSSKTHAFVDLVCQQDCWFGALDSVDSFERLYEVVTQRINLYRKWVNGNISSIEQIEHISNTKTNIGEPISRVAECIRISGMISNEVPVLIRVDQIEELHRTYTERQGVLLLGFRKMINRAFAARDARVHYRAGTRRYGWRNPDFLVTWGSEARLEERRDYLFIDMDKELFARGEVKNSIFEKLAADTFYRRVRYFLQIKENLPDNLLNVAFGNSPKPHERIQQLNFKKNATQVAKILSLDSPNDGGEWTVEWREFLTQLFNLNHEGMLNAILSSAWGRQSGGGRNRPQHRNSSPPSDSPWENRKWWRKERLSQAVLQLTTRSQQRYMWWGVRDIISLSGGNITVFLHICHRVWDAFLKSQSSLVEEKKANLFETDVVDKNIQSSGILFASNEWFKKLPEEPRGNTRQTFVERLGTELNRLMMNDLSMSYPGGNGISIALSEFNSDDESAKAVKKFLQDLIDFGVLFSTEHSSKSKAGGKRIKFYLHPILCPRFQLPESRTKEPYYWNMDLLIKLIEKAGITLQANQKADSHELKTKNKSMEDIKQESFDF